MKHVRPIHVLACWLLISGATALADDHGNTCATATAVLTDGTATPAIVDPVTDEDWFSFSAVAGNRYEATTFVVSTAFVYSVEVVAPDCTTVVANWDFYSPDEHSFIAATTDTYYVRIASISASYVGYVELGLTDQGPTADDHSGGRAGATAITPDGTVFGGVIDYIGDVDWFQFAGVGQHLYKMEVRSLAPPVDPYIYWYVRADLYEGYYGLGGTAWTAAIPGGPDGDWVSVNYYVPAGGDGTRHVRVNGWAGQVGAFEVRVTDLASGAADDHGDTCAAATAITPDGSVTNAIIDPGTDEDWLSVSCTAGYRYEFTTLTPSGVFYHRTQLIDSDCATVLAEWTYATPNEPGFFAPATGVYYLKNTSADGTTIGSLAVGVTDRGSQADDHSGMQSGATATPTDGTVQNGTIHYAGDYDYFTFSGLPDHLYSIQLRALTYVDSFGVGLVFFGGAGQLDFSDFSYGGPDGPGAWTGLVYGTPSAGGGVYNVLVYGRAGESGGSYELTVTDLGVTPADDHSDISSAATVVTTDGVPVGGVLGHGGDHDWFRFTADSQRVYSVEVRGLASPDAGIVGGSLYAPDGVAYLGFAGWSYGAPGLDGDWARVLYYVPSLAAGDYLIDVSGLGFTAGNYQVRVILGAGVAGDFDGDGILDGDDNCPTVANPGQEDSDFDGVGDCCDPDSPDADGDGVADTCDNCPGTYNPGQLDTDHDGVGDVCESLAGDMNCDGLIDTDDIPLFIAALLNVGPFGGCDINRADVNSDTRIDGLDVQPFVKLLVTEPPPPVLSCDDAARCQIPDQLAHGAGGSYGLTADRLANGGNGFWVAEDFHVATGGDITQLCFAALYHNFSANTDCGSGAVDNFEIVYYDADGVNGRPGTVRAGPFRQSDSTLSIDRSITGHQVLLHAEYRFKANHAPVAVTAGECVWIEISNGVASTCSWVWETAPAGNARNYQDTNATPGPQYAAATFNDSDLSLCVGPSPVAISPASCPQVAPANNDCVNAISIGNGSIAYSTISATTDGPDEPAACNFSGFTQVGQDIWYCYTASCTGHVTVNLCSSSFDTKVAIYNTNASCACPAGPSSIACNDDFCGLQSQVVFPSVAGHKYLIRVGGYTVGVGTGTMTVSCGP